jgi:integrase
MRRTHSTLMKEIGVDAKLVADQLGHEVDVDINTNTLTSVELRQAAVNQLESFVGAKQCSNGAQEIGYARK